MSLPIKRFESLDNEFNVAMGSLDESVPTDITNAAYNTVEGVSDEVRNLIDKINGVFDIDAYKKFGNDLKDAVAEDLGINKLATDIKNSEIVRDVRGMYDSVVDFTKFTAKEIEKISDAIFDGSPALKNLFKQLDANCRLPSMAGVVSSNRYSPFDNGCYGGDNSSQSCNLDVGAIAGILDKFDPGSMNLDLLSFDKNTLLNKLNVLSNMGYNAQICGVMGAVINGAGIGDKPDVISRLTSTVLLNQASRGNTLAVMDISKSVSGTNLPYLEAPHIASESFSNFKVPKLYKDDQIPSLSDRYLESIDEIDKSWRKSSFDNTTSVSKMGNYNPQLAGVLNTSVKKNTIDINDLTTTYSSDTDIITSAYTSSIDKSRKNISTMMA